MLSHYTNGIVFYDYFVAGFDFADVDFVYGGDFADDGADGNDGFTFFVYHACGCGSVFLHSVERVAADCAAFALWENEDFALDALTVELVSLLDDNACVWVNAAVEGNRHLRNEGFSFCFAFVDYSAL